MRRWLWRARFRLCRSRFFQDKIVMHICSIFGDVQDVRIFLCTSAAGARCAVRRIVCRILCNHYPRQIVVDTFRYIVAFLGISENIMSEQVQENVVETIETGKTRDELYNTHEELLFEYWLRILNVFDIVCISDQ